MIVRRVLADGNVTWDVRGKFQEPDGRIGNLHLGTFRDRADAEALQAAWLESAARDRQIVRDRQAAEVRSQRRAAHQDRRVPCVCSACDEPNGDAGRMVVRFGSERRPRQAGRWMPDPTGDMAALHVDRER